MNRPALDTCCHTVRDFAQLTLSSQNSPLPCPSANSIRKVIAGRAVRCVVKLTLFPMLWVIFLCTSIPAKASILLFQGELTASQVAVTVCRDNGTGDVVSLLGFGCPDGTFEDSSTTNPDGSPASTSTGSGKTRIWVNTTTNIMVTNVTWSGLTGPVDRAHWHFGPSGVSARNEYDALSGGPLSYDRTLDEMIYPICALNTLDYLRALGQGDTSTCDNFVFGDWFGPSATQPGRSSVVTGQSPCLFSLICGGASGEIVYVTTVPEIVGPQVGDAEWLNFMKGQLYFIDLHTEAFPSGEIRGQVSFLKEESPTLLSFSGTSQAAQAVLKQFAVPEPASLYLLGLGLAGIGFSRRKKA